MIGALLSRIITVAVVALGMALGFAGPVSAQSGSGGAGNASSAPAGQSAQRVRSIAILNGAASDQEAGALAARRLRQEMIRHATLRALRFGELAQALETTLPRDSNGEAKLDSARAALERADKALARLDYAQVLGNLFAAETQLLDVPPSPAATKLLARLVFVRGDVYLRQARRDEALDELRAARNLDPQTTQLDAARYRPALVRAFVDAGTPQPADSTLRITAQLDNTRIFLDGRPVGVAPTAVRIIPGIHYVAAARTEPRIPGQKVIVPRYGSIDVDLVPQEATLADRARSLRRALTARASITPITEDPGAVRAAAERTAALADVEVLLIIGEGGNKALRLAKYTVEDRQLSPWRAFGSHTEEELLGLLGLIELPQIRTVKPHPNRPERNPGPPEPIDSPWWQSNRIRVSLALGVIVSVVGFSLYQASTSSEQTVSGSTCCRVRNGRQ